MPSLRDHRAVSIPRRFPSLVSLLLPLLLWVGTGCERTHHYPDRPIVMVSPWAAGGGTDRVARHVATLLEQDLGVPVNVVNATGGAGVTGHSRGALARPDGYTITMLTVEINMLHWLGLTSITHKDFAPVALVNRDPAALFVRADAPWKTLKELEDALRARPGKLRASGTAKGGIWHLALVGWLGAANLPTDSLIWIPINGSAPSLQQLLSGGVEVVSTSLPEARTLLDAGKIRSLGVMSDAPLEGFPDIPTLIEQDRAWTLGAWRGIGLPAETPPEIVAVMSAALDRVLSSQAYTSFMKTQGFNPEKQLGDDFAATLTTVDKTMGDLLRGPGFSSIKPDRFGPYYFPTLLGIALGMSLIGLVVIQIRARGTSAAKLGLDAAAKETATGASSQLQRGGELVAAVVVYILLSEPLGYIVTGALVTGALMFRLGTRPRTIGISLLALIPCTYHLFAVLLRVPLPRGLFGW